MYQLPSFGYNIFNPAFIKNLNDLFLPGLAQNHLTLHHVNLLLQFEHVLVRVRLMVTELDNVLFLRGQFAFEDLAEFLL